MPQSAASHTGTVGIALCHDMPLSVAATVARGKAERDEGARRCAWGEKAPRHHQSTLSRGPETDDAQSAPSCGGLIIHDPPPCSSIHICPTYIVSLLPLRLRLLTSCS